MDHAQRNDVMYITLSTSRGCAVWTMASPDIMATEPQA